jgi:hypothetical protein
MGAVGEVVNEWGERGVMFGRTMEPAAVAAHVTDLLAAHENVSVTRVVPHYKTD